MTNDSEMADWLRWFTSDANPDEFTAAFSSGALNVLEKAGQPATVDDLKRVETVTTKTTRTDSTVAHRIYHDSTLPEQVRLAPEVIIRAEKVRYWIDQNNARKAVTETARLFAVVGRSIDIDAEPYIKAGAKAHAARRVTAAAKMLAADTRAKLIRPIWDEWTAANPKAKDPERFDAVGELAHQRHPEAFKTIPGEQTIRDLRARNISGKETFPGIGDSV